MKKNRVCRRMGMAALAGGLAFVGTAEAVELLVDGSFENTSGSSNPVVKTGGKTNPGLGGGWSTFSTYLYSTGYTLPLTNGAGVAIGGAQFLRPYPAGSGSIPQSSDTVTQLVSLTTNTTLTDTKIDSGLATYTMSAWFSSYLTQGDYSDLTLTFLDASTNVIGSPVALGGSAFVTNLLTGANSKYPNAKYWGKDVNSGTIPSGARKANVLIHSTSVYGLPDGYVDLVSLDVVDKSQTTPTVSNAQPPDNAINAGPVVGISVGLQDRGTSVDTNSIRLYLDNQLVSAVIQKAGTNTTVQFNAGLLPSLSAHSYAIAFSDNGTTVTRQTNTFHFTVANYLTLPASLQSPLGSEDTTKPGFNVSVYQLDALFDPTTSKFIDIPSSIEFDEAVLAGLAGTNVADFTIAEVGDRFAITSPVHWQNATGTTPNFPGGDPFPGIPGIFGNETDFVDEVKTFVRFPSSGFYQLGVNNNDDLRLTAAESGTLSLRVTAPTNMPIPCVAIATNVTQLLFGGALPLSPLSATVVYATPSGNPDDACLITTNSGLTGKIALLDRGSTNCSSSDIAYKAQLAGAVAVLETTPGDIGFPIRLGDNDPRVTIPVLVIAEDFGATTLKSYLTNHVSVTATIQGDPAPRLMDWNGPKGYGSVDSLSGFAVPLPGLYPFRLVSGHVTGAADLEWFSIQPDGTRILLNDTNTPGSLLTFRSRTVVTPLKLNAPTVTGGSVTISWTGSGTLQEATVITGPWQAAPSQLNPQTVQASGTLKLYRLHNP